MRGEKSLLDWSMARQRVILFKGEGGELYDMAMEKMAYDTSMQIGQLQDFVVKSSGLINTLDLDNEVNVQKAIGMLKIHQPIVRCAAVVWRWVSQSNGGTDVARSCCRQPWWPFLCNQLR